MQAYVPLLNKLRRAFDARGLAAIIALFIALTLANYVYFSHRLQVLAHPATLENIVKTFVVRETTEVDEYHWLVGREIALTVLTIGSIWARYCSDRGKVSAAGGRRE